MRPSRWVASWIGLTVRLPLAASHSSQARESPAPRWMASCRGVKGQFFIQPEGPSQ
jgi:hypothetical protein